MNKPKPSSIVNTKTLTRKEVMSWCDKRFELELKLSATWQEQSTLCRQRGLIGGYYDFRALPL